MFNHIQPYSIIFNYLIIFNVYTSLHILHFRCSIASFLALGSFRFGHRGREVEISGLEGIFNYTKLEMFDDFRYFPPGLGDAKKMPGDSSAARRHLRSAWLRESVA